MPKIRFRLDDFSGQQKSTLSSKLAIIFSAKKKNASY
jgi:hypothetical protein